MRVKTIAPLAALLLASGIGCGQQSDEAPTDSVSSAAAPVAAPAPPPPRSAPPPTDKPSEETPAPSDEVTTGEAVQVDKEGSESERANKLLAQAVAPSSSDFVSRWKPGVNYSLVTPAQPTSAPPDKVEVVEFFWYGCPHCYGLEPYLQNWGEKKASYIHFARVPVVWGPVHRLHAQLYYTLLALGREDLHMAAFREAQVGNRLIGRDVADTERVQLEFAKRNGISGDAFTKAYRSKEVTEHMQRAEELLRRYKVQDVPRMVVGGKYMTNVGSAGGQSQLIALINDLAAREHKKQ